MFNPFKRPIGKILLDGKFVSPHDLERALKQQERTKELLGQVLVKMGVLSPGDVNAPLLVQGHLSSIDDAVNIAAGERQLLGALLVQSGHITSAQLDQAIAEQKRTGEKIGQVLVRLVMLSKRQLTALLDFQKHQTVSSDSPLRLGELLVATGHISREKLEHALQEQTQTGKKLGEVLVADGYVKPSQIKYGISMQKMLRSAVTAAVLALGSRSIASASSATLSWDLQSAPTNAIGFKVYYSTGSDPIGAGASIDVLNQSHATINDLDPVKTYNFAVTGYDSAGVEMLYSNIVNITEEVPPTVTITSPANATAVSGNVSINLDAADNVEVSKVEFYINGVLTAMETVAPYSYSWDTSTLASGSYSLTAKVYDSSGNVTQSSDTIVSVGTDLIAPKIALTSPANYSTVTGTISVTANASDNIVVSKVEYYSNGSLINVSNAVPFSINWDTTSVANGAYALMAVAYDDAGNAGQSSTTTVTVNNPVADSTAPTLGGFSLPATSTSLTVPVSGLSATDNVGVAGYLITESATAPAASAAGWSSTAPSSFTFSAAGIKTAYAWAKDAAGNVSASRAATVQITLPDITAPLMTSFTLPTTSTSLTVPISGLSATDAVGVTGYLISESATAPLASDSRWSSSAPTSITFSAEGTKTAYAWAKDAAGNVSAGKSASVTITMPDLTAPTINTFTMKTSSASLKVPVTSLTGSDNVGVTGYLITENSTKPSATASGWKTTAPTSFTFSSTGTKIAYAWVKDASGNVSASKSVTVRIR